MSDFDPEKDPTDKELWDRTVNGVGEEKTLAIMALAHEAYNEGNYPQAAGLQERLGDVYRVEDNPEGALIAYARAVQAWTEAEDWAAIELIDAKARSLESECFQANAWRDYYANYAWAAHLRRAPIVALEAVDRALTCAKEMDSEHFQAFHLWQKGSILATLGRSRQAAALLAEAILLARSSGSIALIVDILAESALVEAQLMNAEASLDLAHEAQTLFADVPMFPGLEERMRYALGAAYLANNMFDEAFEQFNEVVDDVPTYRKIQTMIRLSECMFDESAAFEARAYVLARNTNTWDLFNHLETNRAMALAPAVAIPMLESVIERARENDDDFGRDCARLVLARKLLDSNSFTATLQMLNELSVASFGDDFTKVVTYLVLRADALIALGELVEAASIASTLTRLDRGLSFGDAIAEGYWQLAEIEMATNGATPEWERNAHSSIAFLARTRNFALLRERAQIAHNANRASGQKFQAPIETVEDLLADIANDVNGFTGEESLESAS